ncbi:MAG: Coenzyme F420 hydrogenase/dehydrogenase, beta subunit C-terminal domain [Candidatus Bathyarchaeota archaeon]|nr:Coenzyme F420 hydrogenase/dehydrogenase, beta subunit C-terminal domain [Candidatus Bathyarchaeota archaeon]
MQPRKLGFEESLEKDVVSTSRCVGCAGCVVVCPFKCLNYDKGEPKLVKKCETCGICPRICPKYKWSMTEAEEYVFGRKRKENEDFGIYRRLTLARALDKQILRTSQDGGVVSGLLAHALQNGIIEGAAISGLSSDKPLHPLPILAASRMDVLRNAGTRYSYSPNLLALQEGIRQKKKSLAFVGTPCQIHTLRRIQMFPLKKYASPLQFAVGLMCTESFTYDGLFKQYLEEDLGVDLRDVKKMNIKGKILVSLTSGETKSIPLSEAKQYARVSCGRCSDFSAELADISTGGLGLSGWTFTILRTEKGERIFDEAVASGALETRSVDEEPFAQSLLRKLSERKQRNLDPI